VRGYRRNKIEGDHAPMNRPPQRSLMYPVIFTPDDSGTLLVTCPALPEVTTFGKDEEDAMQRAVDAIEEALAARIAHREDIPAPSTHIR